MRPEYCEWAEKTQQTAERIEGMKSEERDQLWNTPSDFWTGGGKPRIAQCDFETYSEIDIGNCGSYRYIGDDSFEVLMLAVAFDDEPVFVIDVAKGEKIPDVVWASIFDEDIISSAWNAQFERTIFGKLAGHTLSPDSWRCSMVWSASLSLPLALKNAAAVLKTGEQKDKAGEALIKYFSMPCKATKTNGGRTRNLPEHDPEKWQMFKSYCLQDVRTERDIRKQLERFPLPDREWDFYHLDQRINDRGVKIDKELVEQAITCDLMLSEQMTQKAYELTGLENPNSVSQLKSWLEERGIEVESLGKKNVATMITELDKHSPDGEALEMLKLRLQMAKSSVKKYQAANRYICSDGRAHGLFQFAGANRTARWAGRGIQLQNLYRNEISTLDEAREFLKMGAFDVLEMVYGNTPDILSQLIRTMLIPKDGCEFIVADFSAIEARVLAWLAGEEWVLESFRKGEDLYCSVASQMFGVPVEKHGINGELRQKGKIATLACGYGGSTGALINMGALEQGLKENELQDIIDSWRKANPNIVKFWWDVERAATKSVKEGTEQQVGRIRTEFHNDNLWIVLPSGRKLNYINACMQPNRFGRMAINFYGLNAANKWALGETYSGKLVENCIAEGTLVMTGRGLLRIETITEDDVIWDGEEYVRHDGVIRKGEQETVEITCSGNMGICMTAEHKILTTKGWRECCEATGLEWKKVRIPDCIGEGRKRQEGTDTMEMPVLLWKRGCDTGIGAEEAEQGIHLMRLHEESDNFHEEKNTWDVSSPGFCGLALDDTEMRESESSGLSQLWRTWNKGLRKMETFLREFLGRHGSFMEERTGFGPDRQQQGIQSGELSMGGPDDERKKSKVKQNRRFTLGEDDRCRTLGKKWDRCNDAALPSESRMACGITVHPTGRKECVYDIRNCGPRHRFAIWDPGAECLRIVSNCTQATARDLLAEAMWRMEQAGLEIVGHVHDEVILEVPKGSITVDDVVAIMTQNPTWADGLPLNAAGYSGDYYFKD